MIIWKISQKSKDYGQLMNSVCKESNPEGTQLLALQSRKLHITERVETLAVLSKTASKMDLGGDCKRGPSGYSSGSGKNIRLYNKGNQNS